MTYLSIVNNILKRLRERTVGTVNESEYSTLVGMFVNDAKQEIEESWNWSALRTTLTANTTQGVFAYELTGAGDNLTVLDVVNDTDNFFLEYRSARDFNNFYLNSTPSQGSPRYYSFNGIDDNGDTIAEVFPPPDGAYAIRFNVVIRPADLAEDSDTILVPSKPVEMLAYAKAIEERGEDGGVGSSAAYAFAQQSLNTAMAYDAAKHPEETVWTTI